MLLAYKERVVGLDYDETKHTVRVICIVIALISNFYLLGFMGYKLIKKERQFNILFGGAIASITFATIAIIYNLFYRFMISKTGCPISDIMDEFIIAIARSILLLFYVLLIYKIFENTNHSMNDHLRNALFAFIVTVHMILLPSLYIFNQTGTVIQTNSYGIYCRNEMEAAVAVYALVFYHIVDTLITVVLCMIFVYKLREMLNAWKENDDEAAQDEDASDDDANSGDKGFVTDKLVMLMKKRLVLMVISIVSSWVIILGGRLDINSDTPFRWIYPLDYVINGWCIFLLFDWGESLCSCISDKLVANNKDVETGTANQEKETNH